jgi:hypothetical protein
MFQYAKKIPLKGRRIQGNIIWRHFYKGESPILLSSFRGESLERIKKKTPGMYRISRGRVGNNNEKEAVFGYTMLEFIYQRK